MLFKIVAIYCICDDLLKLLQRSNRKKIETVFGEITRLFPKSIQASSARGFEFRIFLFILSYSINLYCSVTS